MSATWAADRRLPVGQVVLAVVVAVAVVVGAAVVVVVVAVETP